MLWHQSKTKGYSLILCGDPQKEAKASGYSLIVKKGSSPVSRKGYSLIELLIVLAIITIIALTAIPNLFNRNDRFDLDATANRVKQAIVDARTRSLAPGKNDTPGSTQVYQVTFGNFSKASVNHTVVGDVATNDVRVQKGQAQCDSGDLTAGFTDIRQVSIPRGIYISQFYPTNQDALEPKTVIRFSVGQAGFTCGKSSNPEIKSTQLHKTQWAGDDATGNSTSSRYLLIELSSKTIGEKRYVLVDRITSEVTVARTNPQSYFTPVSDSLPPRWDNFTPTNFNLNFLLSVNCGSSFSDVTMSFPRARDRVNDPINVDPNLFVAYDISWKPETGQEFAPLAIKYFYPLTVDTVRFSFNTDLFSVANRPHIVTITVTASDDSGQSQIEPPVGTPRGVDNPRQKVFSQLTCGSHSIDEDPIQGDPGGQSTSCNPIIAYEQEQQKRSQLWRFIFPTAYAQVPIQGCL